MENGYARGRDLERLTELCRELAKAGVQVGLSDARPALSVRRDLTGRKVWVEVDASGGSFVWRRDDLARHPVGDPAGAAARLAEHVRNRDGELRPGWCIMQSATVVVAFAARRLDGATLLAHLEHRRGQNPPAGGGEPYARRAALAKIDRELHAIERLAVHDGR